MPNVDKYLRNIFLILLVFLFLVILVFSSILASTLVPVYIAFFTSMFLQPFIGRLTKLKVPFWLAVIIVYFIFILFLAVILTVLSYSFASFVQDLPMLTREFREKLVLMIKEISEMELFNEYLKTTSNEQVIKMIQDTITFNNINTFIIKPLGITFDVVKGLGLYALSLIFIIPFIGTISKKIIQAFPDNKGKKINQIIDNINESIQNYLVAKAIISFVVGLLSFIICLIFGIKYALLWGAIIFLFNFIPVIGSIIAVCFPLIMGLVQNQSMIFFSLLLLCLSTVQVLMGSIIEPQFQSKGVNLSPLVIFMSLMIWGYIWGIAGVILSVPIMSAINIVCANIEPLKPLSVLMGAEPRVSMLKKFVNKKIRKRFKHNDKDDKNNNS